MAKLGALTVYLNSNSSGLERGLAQASSMLKKFAATAAGYMAVSSLKNLADESLRLAGVQEKAENMMARTLRNTAGMADFTVGELKRYAAEAQHISIFGDEKVMEAQTMLMQMNSVTGDAFKKTRDVALDIASAKGYDLTAVMQNLGKALQDPVKGIKQLRDYGTDPAMKQQIEERIAAEGKEAAQIMILEDLQKRYQGAAAVAADTISGAFIRNQNALGDLKESFGFLINEIFNVKGALETTQNWFGEWAEYLRSRAGEIAFAFKYVWIDIQTNARKLYLIVAPVINQISAVVEAAYKNLMEFFKAVPKLLSGEEFTMKFYTPVFNLLEGYRDFWKQWDQIDKETANAHSRLEKQFSMDLDKKAEQNITRGAEKGAEEGIVKGMVKANRQKFENPSAILGSADAWKIITSAMSWEKAKNSLAAVPDVSSGVELPAPVSISPVKFVKPAPAVNPSAQSVQPVNPSVLSRKEQAIKMESNYLGKLWDNIKENLAVNPFNITYQALKNPEKTEALDRMLNTPQAKKESVWNRILMGATASVDSRNRGVTWTGGDMSSPITKEQIKLAREQLAATKATNRAIEKINFAPANLGGF